MRYSIKDFFLSYRKHLLLQVLAGEEGLSRLIYAPEAHRPGLGLAGYLHNHAEKRLLVFGKVEIEYLAQLSLKLRRERLEALLGEKTPALIVTRRLPLPEGLMEICTERQMPLLRTPLRTTSFLSRLTFCFSEVFAPTTTRPGTLVEVCGLGVLIEGDSSVGKSEAALGLIAHGHCLICDDVVNIRRREHLLEGSGDGLTRHHLEIRGIGILNVATLFGTACVRSHKEIDLVVKLENWDDDHEYDRLGIEERWITILGVKVPYYVLPVKPGRNLELLIRTVALNDSLKKSGCNAARDFQQKQRAAIAHKSEYEWVKEEESSPYTATF